MHEQTCAPYAPKVGSRAPGTRRRRPAGSRLRIAPVLVSISLAGSPCLAVEPSAISSSRADITPATLTLRDALLRALRESPRLPGSALELRAREAESLQAGLLPNPALTTEVEDFGGGGSRNG